MKVEDIKVYSVLISGTTPTLCASNMKDSSTICCESDRVLRPLGGGEEDGTGGAREEAPAAFDGACGSF